jgi:hypothetical protein
MTRPTCTAKKCRISFSLQLLPGTDVVTSKISSTFVCEKMAFFVHVTAIFLQNNVIKTLVFKKNATFFAGKLAKNAANCDNNIDPRTYMSRLFNFKNQQ